MQWFCLGQRGSVYEGYAVAVGLALLLVSLVRGIFRSSGAVAVVFECPVVNSSPLRLILGRYDGTSFCLLTSFMVGSLVVC